MMTPWTWRTPTVRSWLAVLIAVLAIQYLALGVVVGGVIGAIGLGGAVLIGVAIGIRDRSRPIAAALLIAGTVPFALLLWWSVIAPALGIVTLILGSALLSRGTRDAGSLPQASVGVPRGVRQTDGMAVPIGPATRTTSGASFAGGSLCDGASRSFGDRP